MKSIYPFGNCGKAIASILDFFGEEYKRGIELENDECVLVATKRYKYQIQQELKAKNIHNLIDGVKYAAIMLQTYLNNIVTPNSVALILDDYRGQKHFGNIKKELKKKNINVYKFIYPDVLEYENSEYDFVICQDMIPYLECFKMFVCTGILLNIPKDSYCLRIPSHYYIFDYHAFYHDPKTKDFWAYKNAMASVGGGIFEY